MWELDHKKDWTPKNWWFWTAVLEKTLENPLDCKEIKSVNPKGNKPWIFIGRADAKAEAPILWPPNGKIQLTGKDPDAGKDWRQEEKGMTEGKMVGWHYQPNGHEFEQTLGDGEGQGSLVCCSPWGRKESDTTEQLNNNKIKNMTYMPILTTFILSILKVLTTAIRNEKEKRWKGRNESVTVYRWCIIHRKS